MIVDQAVIESYFLRKLEGKLPIEESPSKRPSGGRFYYLKMPDGSWKLFDFQDNDFEHLNQARQTHDGMWRSFIVKYLAEAWAPKLGADAKALATNLAPYPYAMPRGYVSLHSDSVEYGAEPIYTSSRKDYVERVFNVVSRDITWHEPTDEHDGCNPYQKKAVCALLKIEDPDW